GEGRSFGAGRWYDIYGANLQRTYGGDGFDQKRWTTHTLDRLQAWGFNTVGNWSDDDLARADRVPYTLPLSIVG
ncbi:hypothetical protein, partial [Salmonella enterica]|uniref:hypothetical protein n=1 Tax=Salmonella enterica TaxID=28901 RepID=UPI0032981ACA